jgi:aspartate/methionine/tyrosine aminotransferase
LELISKLHEARHYTTISVSQLDSWVAAFALSQGTVHKLLARNISLAKENLAILEKFVDRHDDCVSWTKPLAGTTAFLRFTREGKDVDGEVLCERLVKEVGVLWAPGKVFGVDGDFAGHVRIGFCCETEVLKDGLEKVRQWMRKNFDDVPLVA